MSEPWDNCIGPYDNKNFNYKYCEAHCPYITECPFYAAWQDMDLFDPVLAEQWDAEYEINY